MRRPSPAAWLACVLLVACDRAPQPPPLFELLSPQATRVTFRNDLPEDTAFNILNYLYYYNGGGVAAGDVNNDGLVDLYFTSNVGPDRLYLNRGDFRFDDVTENAGVAGPTGWSSGVTMADVNGDGHLDIYVCAVSYLAMRGSNVLYVNNGDGTFSDRTKELGLEHTGYSTQAAFFDYDGDGDLDMYLLNSSTHTERGPSAAPQRAPRHPRAGDRLFRNDGAGFTDVSDRAGIYGGVEGYGLGVVASDLNLDGCVDLYIANDFQENDFLYFNNCDGTFRESIAKATGHTSQFAMGVDAADIDNDLRPDLAVLDMLPDREDIRKSAASAEPFGLSMLKMQAGYHPQFARNTLQLNRGDGRFIDIGFLAGVHATDWSWAPLFADFDNDGLKDLFVTNGIHRRPNDFDYIEYVGNREVQRALARGINRGSLGLLDKMPQVPQPNYLFRNNGNLTFTNVAERWGLAQPGFSNGAAYVDLDNDGALDLVVNNVNAPASIYRNRARSETARHYLGVRVRGTSRNPFGIGARVMVHVGDRVQVQEVMPTRGFQSAVDTRVHFGLDTVTRVDSVTVWGPAGHFGIARDVRADQTITIVSDGSSRWMYAIVDTLLADHTSRIDLSFRHVENDFVDFNREPLLPHMLSTEGPALAVADVNGDSLDDVYIGGAKGQAAGLFAQQRAGSFRRLPVAAFNTDSAHEDVAAEFFDADGDHDMDLVVISGGNEYDEGHPALRHRLYINDGRGIYTARHDALPPILRNGSSVAAADFDKDGDVDLFIGTRNIPRKYGVSPQSHLLRNQGGGRFTDVTAEVAPDLSAAGMVTDAAWVDYDGNGAMDLIVVGEWMPVRVFSFVGGKLEERTRQAGMEDTQGWWNSVSLADLNGDARPDLILGNLGLNSFIKASANEPARLYVQDFDDNGVVEPIFTIYRHGEPTILNPRDELFRAIPSLSAKFPTYAAYGAARLEAVLPPAKLRASRTLEARTFASAVALNQGNGSFALRPLPVEAQFAPVYDAVSGDFDGDGRIDILLAGNLFGVPPWRGRYDASAGVILQGDGRGAFTAIDLASSGLAIDGQVRGMALLRTAGSTPLIAIARNNDTVQILRPTRLPRSHSP